MFDADPTGPAICIWIVFSLSKSTVLFVWNIVIHLMTCSLQEEEILPAQKSKSVKKKVSTPGSTSIGLRAHHPPVVNHSESSHVTTTSQSAPKDVPVAASSTALSETVNSSSPATSTAVKAAAVDYTQSVIPPSQPTKVHININELILKHSLKSSDKIWILPSVALLWSLFSDF